jgi:hypothetical protein
MRRILSVLILAAALAGCGGTQDGARAPAATSPDPAKAQAAARKLLADFENCGGCTGAERARERIENGLVGNERSEAQRPR